VTALAATLEERLDRVRRRTCLLYESIDTELAARAAQPYMSPPVWDLGHIAAYEELWLVERLGRGTSLHPDLQSAYDAFETPRAARTTVSLLDLDGCRRYLDAVRERSLASLHDADLSEDGPVLTRAGEVFEMVVEHEAQHTETVLQALKLLPPGTYRAPQRPPTPPAAGGSEERVLVGGAIAVIGANGCGFAYDCERPHHVREVGDVWLDRFPVTNGRHLAFIEDGGYRRSELWSDEGWRWREQNGVDSPLYWENRGADGWVGSDFDGLVPVDPALPVCHVSYYEAEAHARWAGARLPTELEWERAAAWDGARARVMPWGEAPAEGRANLDQLAFGPAPVGAYPEGAAACGCEQMAGDVWEWTSTELHGYPGFRAFPYPEYSQVFFGGGYRVLRGGSWATQPVAIRNSFRNWDHPHRRQIFSGFRLARDLA
jgi:iron(II)-dependent oxidoreductase